jgi:hypothetical protein
MKKAPFLMGAGPLWGLLLCFGQGGRAENKSAIRLLESVGHPSAGTKRSKSIYRVTRARGDRAYSDWQRFITAPCCSRVQF